MSSVIPKSEYPRPDLDRSHRWKPLNGEWILETPGGSQPITVPFAWETAASGVGRTWMERATYRREVTAPASWEGARVFICFGAVHHTAIVAIDGVVVGEHIGGYTSFEFDLAGYLAPGATAILTVDVHAPADKRGIPHGKQRSIPRDDYDGVSFTPTSGIWQSVWLEARGTHWLSTLALRGDSLTAIDVRGTVGGDSSSDTVVSLRVRGQSQVLELIADPTGAFAGRLDLEAPRLWSPRDPHLYSVDVVIGEGAASDRVVASTGLRKIEARGEKLYLNGERFYIRGVLDQGYWPDSGLTAPDDAALVMDIELSSGAGYNLIRKHLKFEEPRFFHHADTMGMLVWAEPASTSRFSVDGAAAFDDQIAPMIERDGNHPSIIVWGLYNEEWGLDWDIPGSSERSAAASRAYELVKTIDSTRPVVENSGWSHVATDLVDWHYYDEDPSAWAANVAAIAEGSRHDWAVRLGSDFVVDKSLYGSSAFPRHGVPIVNSEYGAGFTSLERAWHVRWQTQELRRHDRFAGYVYTELADVEHEAAGLFDTNRRRKDWGGLDPADANAETVIVIDLVPKNAGADIPMPAGAIAFTAHISHHGGETLFGMLRGAWVSAGQPFGSLVTAHTSEVDTGDVEPFVLSGPLLTTTTPPLGVQAARLHLWFVDQFGAIRARTFVDAAPIELPNRRGARR